MVDDRDLIAYEDPRVLSEALPYRRSAGPGLRKCTVCRAVMPAEELTIIKHRHSAHPKGHLRLYCGEHLATAREWDGSAAASKVTDRQGPVCPGCFLTAPAGTSICEECGIDLSSP